MIGARIRTQVWERAQNTCEYCRLHQDDSPLAALHVEHIIPKIHGGTDDQDNLALACIDCNLHKGTNRTGIDPETNKVTELFHPRRQIWDEHFEWRGLYLIGKCHGTDNDPSSEHKFRRPGRIAVLLMQFKTFSHLLFVHAESSLFVQ